MTPAGRMTLVAPVDEVCYSQLWTRSGRSKTRTLLWLMPNACVLEYPVYNVYNYIIIVYNCIKVYPGFLHMQEIIYIYKYIYYKYIIQISIYINISITISYSNIPLNIEYQYVYTYNCLRI